MLYLDLALFIYTLWFFQGLPLMQDNGITECLGYPDTMSKISQYTAWFNSTPSYS